MTDHRRPPASPGPATPEERAEEIAEEYLHHLRARRELEAAHPEVTGLLHAELRLAEAVCGATVVPETTPPAPGPAPEPLQPGRLLGPYQLFEVLGQGGFGTVYQARDTRTGRDVALKVLRRDRAPARDAADRFRRDAVIVALLDHPHAVRLHGSGEIDGVLYLDMELVRGETLEDRLRRAPLPFRDAAELVRKVASALDHAHAREVVHRDVKPSNILLDANGEPRLTDFGLARLASGATLTETRQLLGTLDYMAPEQTDGAHAVDGRADVYSLGVVLYRLLTGRVPFDGTRPLPAVLFDIVHTDPAEPSRINPDVPRDLETICLRAMAKEPEDRLESAADFAAQLGRWLGGESLTIRRPTAWEKARRWHRRHRGLGRAAGAAIVVLLVAVGVALEENRRAAEEKRLRTLETQLTDGIKAQKAEGEALGLLDRARQRLRVPTEGRRRETQDLLRQAARLRNHDFAEDRKESLTLELRSLFAASLAVPELEVAASEEIATPERDFSLVWPAAMHPNGESMAIGTRERPIRYVRGERLAIPEKGAPVRRRPRIAYSQDGKYLAFAPATGGLELWNPEATGVAATLEARPAEGKGASAVVALHFTPDNATLWACWDDGKVRSWSLPELKKGGAWQIGVKPREITAAAFDPSGQVVALGDGEGRVRLASRLGANGPEWAPARAGIVAVAWHPDGQLLAAADDTGTIHLLDRQNGTLRYSLPAFSAGCDNVLFSPDGRWLLAGHHIDTRPMKVWDVTTGEQVLTGLFVPWGFGGDGRRFAGTTGSGVSFCDLLIPDVVRHLTGHRAPVSRLAWSRNGSRFVTLDYRFEVRTWDVQGGVVDQFFAPGRDMHPQNAAVAISDDGHHVAYASGGDQKQAVALLWEPDTHTSSPEWPLAAGFEMMTFTGGRFVLMREELADPQPRERVKKWGRTRSVLYELRPGGRPEQKRIFRLPEPGDRSGFLDTQLTPDAAYHVWVGPRDPSPERRVEVREIATGKLIRQVPRPTPTPLPESFVRLSPDGRWLWVRTGSDNQRAYDLKGDQPPEQFTTLPLAISPDSQLFAYQYQPALKWGETAFGLHFGRGEPPWITLANRDGTTPLAIEFSYDGHYVAWGSPSGAVTVADLPALRKQVEAFEEDLRRD